jgi:hypothetical protein
LPHTNDKTVFHREEEPSVAVMYFGAIKVNNFGTITEDYFDNELDKIICSVRKLIFVITEFVTSLRCSTLLLYILDSTFVPNV